MPYTPPSQRSPTTSNPQSPVLTRNHSFEAQSQHHQARPGLPRSRSATYIHKHRRSPSLTDSVHTYDATRSMAHHGHRGHNKAHQNGTVEKKAAPASTNGAVQRPTHPVLAELVIPTEGSTSPSGSPTNSDEEDETTRGRKLEDIAEKLRETVVSKRGHSPSRTEDSMPAAPKSTPANLANGTMSPGLTPEARKISHSRSASELQLSKYNKYVSSSPAQGSSDSDNDDDGLQMKPQLIRKKSGELVKPALRPASRRRPLSMPGTPTYSKAVHFNEDIEQVRHFLQVDRPIAVSAGSSPIETYDSESEYPFESRKKPVVGWEIRTENFPRDTLERQALPVRVERIFLSPDGKTLIGNVAVANIAFHKVVVARFTLDYWKTTSEVVAEYNNDVRKKKANDGYDRFNFNIKLSDQAHLESKTLLLCVRYNVEGKEFWDNNSSMNFQVDFIKTTVPQNARAGTQGLSGAGSLGAIPRSRHSPTGGRPRSFPSIGDEDFATSFEFGSGNGLLRDAPGSTIRLKNGARKGSSFPNQARQRQDGGSGAFSTRYDFGASLTAALTNAQNDIGNRNGLKHTATGPTFKVSHQGRPAALAVRAPGLDGPRPDKISSERPELHSQEYNDLIQKFCYVGRTSPGLA
jgi:Carbohydrate/starch-binding module (family 21)